MSEVSNTIQRHCEPCGSTTEHNLVSVQASNDFSQIEITVQCSECLEPNIVYVAGAEQ